MSDDSKEQLYHLLKEAFLLLDFGDRQLFAEFELTISRYDALYHINEEPGLSVSRLSDYMFCDKSNATRIVKGLEEEGYVSREPHETDGRTLRIFLTDEGTAVLNKVATAHTRYNEARFDCISDLGRRDLIAGLETLNTRLREALEVNGAR